MHDALTPFEKVLRSLGVRVVKKGESRKYLRLPQDFAEEHCTIYRRIEPFTMTRPPRVYALIEAVKYVVAQNIEGDFVECGVWKGGSVMAMALTLQMLQAERDIHLFDTFEGMSAPTEEDWNAKEGAAAEKFARTRREDGGADWCRSEIDEVRRNVLSTGYGEDRLRFVQGRVEDTLPAQAPERIALLRLDTDFYESTRHELIHLYPRLVSGGVLILDDYGHWQGARQAVDEFIDEHRPGILLNRVDFAGRIAIKP